MLNSDFVSIWMLYAIYVYVNMEFLTHPSANCLPFLCLKNNTGIADLLTQSDYSIKTITFKGKNIPFVMQHCENLAAAFKNEMNFMNWKSNQLNYASSGARSTMHLLLLRCTHAIACLKQSGLIMINNQMTSELFFEIAYRQDIMLVTQSC